MTRADIIKALDWHPSVCQGPQSLLVRIERVVAQAEAQEREASIRAIRAVQAAYDKKRGGGPNVEGSVCSDCIGAIRARGKV
jgi:hypothetical protein